jgi:hypothetical protein
LHEFGIATDSPDSYEFDFDRNRWQQLRALHRKRRDMRDFRLFVPADCVVSNTKEDNNYALQQMQQVLKADVSVSSKMNLEEIRVSSRELIRV